MGKSLNDLFDEFDGQQQQTAVLEPPEQAPPGRLSELFDTFDTKHKEVYEGKAAATFNPEGSGFDYETAKAHGLKPDETGHWPSRVPQTGQILKGQKHPTYNLTLEGEKKAGYEITKGQDGRYFSQAKVASDFGRIVSEPVPVEEKPVPVAPPEKKPLPKPPRKYTGFWDELARSFAGGTLNVASGALGTLAGVSEGAVWDKEQIEAWAQKIHEKAKDPAFAPAKGGGWKGFVAQAVGQAFPFMAAATVSTLATGTPLAAFGTAFAVEGDNAYRDAIGTGASEEEANIERLIVGTINGAIEQMQIGGIFKFAKKGKGSAKVITKAVRDKVWKKVAKEGGKLTKDFLVHSINEGLEEVLQESVSMTVPAMHGREIPKAKEFAMRAGRAGLGGAVAGGILGGAGAITQIGQQQIPPETITPVTVAEKPPEPPPAGLKKAEPTQPLPESGDILEIEKKPPLEAEKEGEIKPSVEEKAPEIKTEELAAQRGAFQKYQKSIPNATEQEIVRFMIEDGLRPPEAVLKRNEQMPEVEEIRAQDKTEEIAKKAIRPVAAAPKAKPTVTAPAVTEGEVKIRGTPQEKKLVDEFAEGLTTQEWREEYQKGELPHWMTDKEPSPLSKELNEDLKKEGIEQANILEIGAGNGRDSIFLAKQGHTATGIDIAEQAVAAANKNASKQDNATFEKGNVEKLKYPDESFDAVFSVGVLHSTLLDDSLAEIHRVLRPGGIAKIHQYTKIVTAGKTIHYWRPEQIKQIAKEAGFSVLESHTTTKTDLVEVEGVREKIKQDNDIIVYTIKKAPAAPEAKPAVEGKVEIVPEEGQAAIEALNSLERFDGVKIKIFGSMVGTGKKGIKTKPHDIDVVFDVTSEVNFNHEHPFWEQANALSNQDKVQVWIRSPAEVSILAGGKGSPIQRLSTVGGQAAKSIEQAVPIEQAGRIRAEKLAPPEAKPAVEEPTKAEVEEPAKEIKDEEETITEPATSLEVEPKKAGELVPEGTGQLDPASYEDALEITRIHAKWVAYDKDRPVWEGIYSTKWDKEKRGHVKDVVEYSPEEVDTAYRTVQKAIPSPMPDTELFAMPGKEAEMQAIAQKMQKVRGVGKKFKKGTKLTKPAGLPKAKTSQADHIKAVYRASAKEETRYAINGVKVEGDTIIATDGRRMFWAKGKWGKDGLYLDTKSLKNGLLGKPYKKDLKFPAWRDIVPDVSGEKPILVNAERAWSDIRRAASMTTVESLGVTVIANPDGSLGFAAASPEVGHVEINIHPGGKILGGVNPQFLLDAISFHAIRGNDSFEFYFPNWERPILTKSFDGKTSTLTMPINIEIEEPSEAIKKAISDQPAQPKKPAGGAAGASVAATGAEAGGGYGTIAANEQSTFAEKTQPHRVAQALPDKTKINVLDELLKIASPAHRVGSREGARVLRKNLGKLSQETVVAHKTLRKLHHAFTFMSRDDIYDFIDRLETGQEQVSPRLTQAAQKFRSMLDERRDAVQALGKGHLETFYENYFPHIWKDPKAAEKAIRQIFGRRRFEGSKAFLKKRTIMTIKDGRQAGLELVSENPVDLVLLKLFEMDRYLMAHHVIQDLKSRGLIKFVYSRSPSPDGYKKIDDRAFTVYMPPEITKKEAYDSIMVDQMMDVARSLGIDTQRFVSLGKGKGRWWGYATWKTKEGEPAPTVRTKYAGPESVLAHEIGHILGVNYQLYDTLRHKKDGAHREIIRGKKKGQQKFVPAEEAVKHRKVIDVEWRALADARIKDKVTSKGFAKYVRKAREKEAVMLEALIHAPEEFGRVAPTLRDLFVKFLNAHSELRPILDIKPSLVLGESEAKIKVPGFTVLGHYYAPEPVAKILNNYLSPGLRNNENILVASGYNMVRMAANMINQAQLALSGFHALNVTTDMMASTFGQGVRRLTVKGQRIEGLADIVSAPFSPILRLWDGVRLRKAYKQQIDTIEDENLRNMVKAVVLADGRDRMDPFYYNRQVKALKTTIGELVHGSPKQKIKGAFKLPLNTFGATLEAFAAPLMQWYVPTGKLGLFTLLAQHEMQRAEAGQINPEQLHERLISSWDSVDNRMGQLVYDNLFWNKTLKDVAMLGVRSVGWNLGSWREYGGVPIDILGTKGRLERGDVLLSQKMAYTIGAVTLYATLGATVMYLLTGKPPEEPKDYFFPKTGRKNLDGSNERISFPTYAKDWFAYGTQPIRTVKNKLHPLWGLLTDLVTNKDFFNTEIRHPGDPISQQLLDFAKHIGKAFISISIRNYQKMQKIAPEAKKKNLWVSITGITSAPSYIVRSPAQKLMYRYIVENIPQRTKTKEQQELYEYRRTIKNRLRKGDPVDRREAIGKLGKASFNRLVRDAKKEPFAESFNRLSLHQALNVYAIASPDERGQVKRLLTGKYHRTRNVTEEMKQMYKELSND